MQNQSTAWADRIKRDVGRRLVTPCPTRWNSLFESLSVLNDLLTAKSSELNKICSNIGISTFVQADRDVIKEYLLVMQPVVHALDILQGENRAYAGILLPTLDILR